MRQCALSCSYALKPAPVHQHTHTHTHVPFREELVCMMVLVGMAVSVRYYDECM
jgi:hypothetical protein